MKPGFALRASLIYAVVASAYKFLSDRILARLLDHDAYADLQSVKGFAFIAITAGLLFGLLLRREQRSETFHDADSPGAERAPAAIVMGATILSAISAVFGCLAFSYMVAGLERAAHDETRTVAELQSGDLGRWLEAEKANATALASEVAASGVADRADLRGIDMDRMFRELSRHGADFHFAAVDLVNAQGESYFGGDQAPAPELKAGAAQAYIRGAPALVDLHMRRGAVGPRFGFVVPIASQERSRASRYALYAELAARDHLFPFVASWPLRRATGASLLVRRERDDILYLTPTPKNPNAALNVRLSQARSAALVARRYRGETSEGRGLGSEGTPIFASIVNVPGTEWALVARIDESEALDDKNLYARVIGSMSALAIAVIWIVAGFLLQSQKLARALADRRVQKRFEITFDQAAVGMAHGDLCGGVLRINRRACEMFGFSREEMLENNVLGLSSPDGAAELDRNLESLRSGERTEYFAERCYRRKDGSWFDASVSVSLARGEGGEPDYLMIVIEDISGRKAAQAALERSEERFRLALESAREGVWDWRPDTDEAYFSPGWKAMLGYGEDEIENNGGAWRRVAAPEGLVLFRKQFDEIRAGQRKTFEFETRLRCRDGSWIDVLSRGLPVFDDKGWMQRVVGADSDITERKEHEAEARLAATVFVSTHEGVVVTDAARNVLMVNPAFEEITGYGNADMHGQNMRKLQSGRHDSQFYRAIWRAVAATGFWRGEIWNRRKNGEIFPEWLTISAVRDASGQVTNYVGLFSDISRVKQSEDRLQFLAHHDPLTGLPNRTLLALRIEHAIERTRRETTSGAVLFLDMDRFKTVNDSLGHPAGDELLRLASERWKQVLRPADTLARVGGDEFVVLLENVSEPSEAALVGQRLIEATLAPFALSHQREACVGLSVGVSLFPINGDNADDLIQRADSALYLAKGAGGAVLRFYSEELTDEANARLALEAGLRRALARGEFALQFQPLVELATRAFVGVEALVRWRAPEGLVAPDQFIPLAERTGLIVPLGEWVLREACLRMKAWRDAGADLRTMAVNFSPLQLARANVVERVRAILEETGLPPHCLEIEITENALVDASGEIETRLGALKNLGVRLAIDDFGAGHSSLFYLRRFAIDKLKLDRDFIRDIPRDPVSMEIAAAVIRMARALGVTALAEGVETDAQADFLAASGCALAQGFLFDKPLWEEALLRRLGIGEARAAG